MSVRATSRQGDETCNKRLGESVGSENQNNSIESTEMEAANSCLGSWCDGSWMLAYRVGVGAVFLGILIASTFGNTMLWCVVRRSRGPQTTTNCFVLSLAAGDMILGAALVPVMLGELWATEDTPMEPITKMCTVTLLAVLMTGAMQAFVLSMVSLDRYCAISQSSRILISRLVARRMVMVAWGAALAVALPMVNSRRLPGEHPRTHENVFSSWCLTRPPAYACAAYTCCTFLLPVFVTAIMYIRLFVHQRQKRRSNIALSHTVRMRWQKVHTLVTVSSLHVIAWLPLNASFCASLMSRPFSPHFMPALLLLVYTMSAVRPVIYYFWNPDFKQGCREVLLAPPSPSCRSNAYIITCPAIPSQRNPVIQPAYPPSIMLGQPPSLLPKMPTPLQGEAVSRINSTPNSATSMRRGMYADTYDDILEAELPDEDIPKGRSRNNSGNTCTNVNLVPTRCTCKYATSSQEDILLGNTNIGKSGDDHCNCFTPVASNTAVWSPNPQRETLKGSQVLSVVAFYASGEKKCKKLQNSTDGTVAPPTIPTLLKVRGVESEEKDPLSFSNTPLLHSGKVSQFSNSPEATMHDSYDQQNAGDIHEIG